MVINVNIPLYFIVVGYYLVIILQIQPMPIDLKRYQDKCWQIVEADQSPPTIS